MKNAIIAISMYLVLQAPTFAQIPVTDVGSIAQLAAQIIEIKKQWKQLNDTYNSFNGARGMSSLLQNAALRKYLPSDWRSVYDKVQSGNYSGLSSNVTAIRDKNAVLSNSQVQSLNAGTAAMLNRQRDYAAIAQGTADDAYQRSNDRIDYLQSLASQVEASPDPKAVMDLQASIASEQALIQNEQIRLQLVAQLQAAQDRAETLRQREEFLQTTGESSARIR